jgi:putative phosphoribosyl transferase
MSSSAAPPAAGSAVAESEIRIPLRGGFLKGTVAVPPGATGLVLFVHGTGSIRLSARNVFTARILQRAGIGTLLFDPLTAAEESIDMRNGHYRFDVGLLAARLALATNWVCERHGTSGLPVGYLGTSTGSAAALVAATSPRDAVQAIVSRGGRPDLACGTLRRITAPTLFIVGGFDTEFVALNRKAQAELRCRKSLRIIPGASHLFEEAGKLERAANLAREWFLRHLHPVAASAHSGKRAGSYDAIEASNGDIRRTGEPRPVAALTVRDQRTASPR